MQDEKVATPSAIQVYFDEISATLVRIEKVHARLESLATHIGVGQDKNTDPDRKDPPPVSILSIATELNSRAASLAAQLEEISERLSNAI